MSIYAIGDLHLSGAVNKPMDKFVEIGKIMLKRLEKTG